MSSPRVSIITPAYNAVSFIEECVASVRAQSITDWEHIIVDDGSSDETFAIMQELAASDPRVIIIKLEKNGGAGVARNAAIERAKGRYIAFLDVDDRWRPEKLATQLAVFDTSDAVLVFSNYQRHYHGESKNIIAPARVSHHDQLCCNAIGCLTAIYDTDKLGKIYMPTMRRRQDYALWLKILRQTDYAYAAPEVLADYHPREGSLSANHIAATRDHWRILYNEEGLGVIRSTYYTIRSRLSRFING